MIDKGTVISVNISKEKGTVKESVPFCELLPEFGFENDAHAGKWHRQVSLLSYESFSAFRDRGFDISYGAFGENLLVEGIDLKSLPVGTRLSVGDALIEITQIGKECHTGCEISKRAGECIMPREGVFARVLIGGTVRPGDPVTVETP